jgi:hypothetical protein
VVSETVSETVSEITSETVSEVTSETERGREGVQAREDA